MIVFLNGPFGVGKTSTAEVLVARLQQALLFDPEQIGFALRAILGPIDPRHDFQDYPSWRRLVVAAAVLVREDYEHVLVVPMTVWRRDYYAELVEGLTNADPDVFSFQLKASERVLRERIVGRPEGDGAVHWALKHLPKEYEAFGDPLFGVEVETDDRTPDEIAKEILARLPPVR